MSVTYNGWKALYSVPNTYFTAPNGKRVYCANEDVATVFEYVAQQWNDRIEELPPATYNIGDPQVRKGYIVIHAYRAPNTTIGTGNMSNHRSATGMDILGDRHPYEASNPPHLKGAGYDDGFTDRQRNELVKIRNEIGRNSRGMWILRLGIHFAIGLRDGMHVEIAPGITALDVKAAATRLRAKAGVEDLTKVHNMLLEFEYPATTEGVRQYQQDNTGSPHYLVVDGVAGNKTITALEADMGTLHEIKKTVDDMHDRQMGNLDQGHNNIVTKLTQEIKNVPAAVGAYRNPGYPDRDVHGLWRDAATAKASSAAIMQALSKATGQPVDAQALADLLRPMLEEIIGEGIDPEAFVDALGKRLNGE